VKFTVAPGKVDSGVGAIIWAPTFTTVTAVYVESRYRQTVPISDQSRM
jgi:hypothetical protein